MAARDLWRRSTALSHGDGRLLVRQLRDPLVSLRRRTDRARMRAADPRTCAQHQVAGRKRSARRDLAVLAMQRDDSGITHHHARMDAQSTPSSEEPTGRANARAMTGSATKQARLAPRFNFWIASLRSQ